MDINYDLSQEDIKNYHIGETYNRLTIKNKAPYKIQPSGQKKRMVVCECSCEKHTIITCLLSNVLRGNTNSCGCYKIDRTSETHSINLIGKKFGRLKVKKKLGSCSYFLSNGKEQKQNLWECECKCGNIVEVTTNCLTQNRTKSCGCLYLEHIEKWSKEFGTNNFKDLTNKRFGKLIAREYKGKDKDKQSLWLCECDCGSKIITTSGRLNFGMVQSCGCIKSKGELQISIILSNLQINYEREKTFKECKDKIVLPFDFYLPEYNLCIEYQGQQHYNPVIFKQKRNEEHYQQAKNRFSKTLKHDRLKREFCEQKGIKLLIIPFWEKGNILKILTEFLSSGIIIINNKDNIC